MSIEPALIEREFPVNRNWVFLNHAGVSSVPSRTVKAIAGFWEDVRDNGTGNWPKWTRKIEETRAATGRLIGAPPEDVAFVSRTTEGINIAAQGLDWRPGDNVILLGTEYPANIYPWMNLKKRGVETRWVQEEDGRYLLSSISAAIDSRTRVVTVSHVEFANGFRNDIRAIGGVCGEKGVLFFVDAIQSLGVFPVDVTEDHVDAVFGGAYKWLLGPTGLGFFYASPSLRDQMEVLYVGADSVVDAEDYLHYDLTLLPDAKRFEYGMLNKAGIIGFGASLSLFEEVGIPDIRARVKKNTDRLIQGLTNKGFTIHSPRENESWSGIVSVSREGTDPEELMKRLYRNRVVTVVRGGRLRLAPHFYNTEDQIDRVVELLGE
jgi:selenocysteine lyase/cysteine desulfurase